MAKRTVVVVVATLGLAVVAFLAFSGSVKLWGSWWREDGLPTPEEWSAFWGSLTLIVAAGAAALALVQLRQNANAALEQSRPFVIVDLHFRGGSLLSIEVKNSGATAARAIDLTWSAVPSIADDKRRDAFMRNLVNAKVPFLAPGRAIRYYVGRFSDYPAEAPRRFEVHASYLGPDGKHSWTSESLIDLDQWANALADSDYENKNWNENHRQTQAQQETAKQMRSVAESVGVVAEFIEMQPAMKKLRREEQARWRASFGEDFPSPSGELEQNDQGSQDT